MYYQVKVLSRENVAFPIESDYPNVYAALRSLFDKVGIEAYELVEKYVSDAFEAESLEIFIPYLQTFVKRATPQELEQFMNWMTEENWQVLQDSPTKIEPRLMEDAGTYWCLNNIIAEVKPEFVAPIEVLSIKVMVQGNGEDALFTQEDTGKYGEIYPFALRLLMDATAEDKAIGEYELSGPIIRYFEGRKETKLTTVPSDEPYDFDIFVDDAFGIAVAVHVLKEPEENEDGEEWATYEILVHPDWLETDLKTDFETFPYSDYA
jgi:hypothetical protein